MFLAKVHHGAQHGEYVHTCPLPPTVPTASGPGYMAELLERQARGATLGVAMTGLDEAVMHSQVNPTFTYKVSLYTPRDLESLCSCRTPLIEGTVCHHVTRLCTEANTGLSAASLVHPALCTTAARAAYTAGGGVGAVTTADWATTDLATVAADELLFHPRW